MILALQAPEAAEAAERHVFLDPETGAVRARTPLPREEQAKLDFGGADDEPRQWLIPRDVVESKGEKLHSEQPLTTAEVHAAAEEAKARLATLGPAHQRQEEVGQAGALVARRLQAVDATMQESPAATGEEQGKVQELSDLALQTRLWDT